MEAYVLCNVTLFLIWGAIIAFGQPPIEHELVLQKSNTSDSPRTFPQAQTDPSTPILLGTDPKSTHLPPKKFPVMSSPDHSSGPPVFDGSEANITQIKKDNVAKTLKNIELSNSTAASQPPVHESEGEQDDMLNSQYKGGQDVDELLKPQKKATEKDEKKKPVEKEPKSDVDISKDFDKSGPKLMSDTKAKGGESMLSSTSQMMAVSSSVLSNAQSRHHGMIEPATTIASVVLSAVVILCLGLIGLLVWKRITQRRNGRDVLINEDDMDDVADMHTFDSAQIQIT